MSTTTTAAVDDHCWCTVRNIYETGIYNIKENMNCASRRTLFKRIIVSFLKPIRTGYSKMGLLELISVSYIFITVNIREKGR